MIIASGFIPGKPRPKGSLKARVHRRGNGKMGITLHDSPESEAWKVVMIDWLRDRQPSWPEWGYAGPVAVEAVFYFTRTIAADGEVWPSHDTPWPMAEAIGDTDKLQRNLGDALEQSGLLANDRNIVRWNARKEWVTQRGGMQAVAAAGVWFRVETL